MQCVQYSVFALILFSVLTWCGFHVNIQLVKTATYEHERKLSVDESGTNRRTVSIAKGTLSRKWEHRCWPEDLKLCLYDLCWRSLQLWGNIILCRRATGAIFEVQALWWTSAIGSSNTYSLSSVCPGSPKRMDAPLYLSKHFIYLLTDLDEVQMTRQGWTLKHNVLPSLTLRI